VGDEPVVVLLRIAPPAAPKARAWSACRRDHAAARPPAAADFTFDGELQARAALVAEVASEGEGLVIGGRANVLIFPDLDAGTSLQTRARRSAAGTARAILQGLPNRSGPVARRDRHVNCEHCGDRHLKRGRVTGLRFTLKRKSGVVIVVEGQLIVATARS